MVSVTTNRLKEDRYYTPSGVVTQMWSHLAELVQGSRGIKILDPSAGFGIFPWTSFPFYPKADYTLVEKDDRPEVVACLEKYVKTIERRGNKAELIIGDFLRVHCFLPQDFDIIATNPPFGLLGPYISICRSLLSDTGVLIFLLRTDWGQSGKSLPILQKNFPDQKWNITGPRLSFRSDGATDTGEYSWWIWQKKSNEAREFPLSYLPPLEDPKLRRWSHTIPGSEIMLSPRRRV